MLILVLLLRKPEATDPLTRAVAVIGILEVRRKKSPKRTSLKEAPAKVVLEDNESTLA
jgi:hypothetical protein